MEIIDKLRQQRKNLGITSEAIAGKLGVTKQTMSHYENHKHDIPLKKVLIYAESVGMEIRLLLK